MMGRFVMFPFLLFLSSCGMPGPRHLGAAPVRLEEGGMRFDIRVRNSRAEAIRTNAMWLPRMNDVARNGGLAIERATGCKVAWLRGDPAVLLAGLDCGNGRPVPRKPRGRSICTGTVSAPYRDGASDVSFSCD